MKALGIVFRLGLLVGSWGVFAGWHAAAQTPAPKEPQLPAPGSRELTGDDARRAKELDKAIKAALKADRWEEAIARGEELLALRAKVKGPKHFETVSAEWRLEALRRVARKSKEDRAAYQSADTMVEQAEALGGQGKYAAAEPLREKVLEIRRRLLTDDHPDTAENYNNLAVNLYIQGKYARAQPLFEKALEIRRRALTDDHPDTAASYRNLAANLNAQGKSAQAQALCEKALEINRRLLPGDDPEVTATYSRLASILSDQGKYAQAQPLFEKVLEIRRRRFTDNHRDTAQGYHNLAANLTNQGKYAQAQPLFEKALEIRRRLFTDDHPETATGFNGVGFNLGHQGKYAQAQPLFEKRSRSAAVCSAMTTPTPP